MEGQVGGGDEGGVAGCLRRGEGLFYRFGWGEKARRAARYKGGLHGTRTMNTKEEKGGVAMIKLMGG